MRIIIAVLTAVIAASTLFAKPRAKGDYPVGTVFLRAEENSIPYKGALGRLPSGCAPFEIKSPAPQNDIVVRAEDFGMSESSDNNAPALKKALEHCKKTGASTLAVKRGTYRFFSNDTVKIHGFKDFVFDGGGSVFLYRKDRNPNFEIVDCERIVLRNIKADWDWDTQPLASVAEVAAVDKSEKSPYIDFKFSSYTNHPYYQKKFSIASCTPYDTETNAVGIAGRRPIYGKIAGMDNIKSYEWLSSNTVRCRFKSPDMPSRAQVGWTYKAEHFSYECNMFNLESNTDTVFENIEIFSCKGFAFRVDGAQRNWCLKKVVVSVRDDGSRKRCISTTADTIHFARSCGNFKMEDCVLTSGGDDCLNVHDSSEFVSKLDEYTVRIPRVKNEKFYGEDHIFELRKWDYSPTGFLSKMRYKKRVGGTVEITFDKPLPDDDGKGFVLFDRFYGSKNISIKKCFFGLNRARGILILADNVSIDGCSFAQIDSGALKIETGFSPQWAEGYGAKNIVVRNCSFFNVNRFGGSTCAMVRDIALNMYLYKDDSSSVKAYPMLRNILFENNLFLDPMGLVAFIGCCDNAIFKDNIVACLDATNSPTRGGFYAAHSKNIKIVNNIFGAPPALSSAVLGYDPKSVSGILFEGNSVVSEQKLRGLKSLFIEKYGEGVAER